MHEMKQNIFGHKRFKEVSTETVEMKHENNVDILTIVSLVYVGSIAIRIIPSTLFCAQEISYSCQQWPGSDSEACFILFKRITVTETRS